MSNASGSKWIRPEKRLAIYARDGFSCAYCGAEADEGAQLSLDHLHPRELGGTHEAANLVTACVSCNSARRDVSLRAWFAMLRDRGVDIRGLGPRLARMTARPLDMALGRRLRSARKQRG